MSLSNSTITVANMELSPVRMIYKGVDLGGTLGNCAIAIEAKKAPIKADQMGETILTNRVSGQMMSITAELGEVQLKDNWKVCFPWINLITSGGNKLVYADSQIGRDDVTDAGLLVLHPLSKADADKSSDYNIYKALSSGKSDIVYGPSGQAKLKVVFNVFPDFATIPARFLTYGDPAIGLIHASAASAVYTGTGNGTLTSVSVFDTTTKTETITIKNVTPQSNAGIFFVSGSVSGALGLATVGVPFVSNQIAFTLNDGTVDFILNDQFTIATTAANYI